MLGAADTGNGTFSVREPEARGSWVGEDDHLIAVHLVFTTDRPGEDAEEFAVALTRALGIVAIPGERVGEYFWQAERIYEMHVRDEGVQAAILNL